MANCGKFLITYLYRDGSNWKRRGEFVVSGFFDLDSLSEYLFDREYFIPAEVGLECLTPQLRASDDHDLHSFESIEPTDMAETLMSAGELLSRIKDANRKDWFSSPIDMPPWVPSVAIEHP